MSDNNFNDEFFNKIENIFFSLLKLLKGRNIVCRNFNQNNCYDFE